MSSKADGDLSDKIIACFYGTQRLSIVFTKTCL